MEKFGLSVDALEVRAQALDADGAVVDRALAVVRDFLSERRDRLVLYGGLGLDFMLRERGARIYPDEERPDYDFYSSRSVDDAQELAGILAAQGFPGVDARRARHVQTMRVRVSFVAVADISFVPEAVLAAIPRMCVRDFRGSPAREVTVVHPHWQFLDQHLALSFPFRDPPMEPVFQRFAKDVRRFNLLRGEYPPRAALPADAYDPSADPRAAVRVPDGGEAFALHGYAAFAAAEWCLASLLAQVGGEPEPPAAAITVAQGAAGKGKGGGALPRVLEIAAPARLAAGPVSLATTLDDDVALARLGYECARRYRPMTDLVPDVVFARPRADVWGATAAQLSDVLLFVLPLRLLAAFRLPVGAAEVRVASMQYVMLHFLLGFHRREGMCLAHLGADAATHLAMYEHTMGLMARGGEALAALRAGRAAGMSGDAWASAVAATPFGLTVQVIGDLNVGEAQLMAIAQDESASHQAAPDPRVRRHVPSRAAMREMPVATYRPGTTRAREFVYGASPWFRLDGGPVEEN